MSDLRRRPVPRSKPSESVTDALTYLGTTLVPVLAALRKWAIEYGPRVLANEEAFDRSPAATS